MSFHLHALLAYDGLMEPQFGQLSKDNRPAIRRVLNLAAFPSLITLGNGVMGFAALVMLAKAYTYLQLGADHRAHASEAMLYAAFYVGIGAFLDMMDGKLARITGTEGAFGKELDSLCDAITFGVTPAVFLRIFGEAIFGSGIGTEPAPPVRLLWFVSALYLMCALIRLARFNVESADEDDDHMSFRGLPTPGAAATCMCLFLISWHFRDPATGQLGAVDAMAVAIPATGVALALLMVSRIRYVHVFNRLLSGKRSVGFFVLTLAILGGIWVSALDIFELIVSGMLLIYVASGPVRVPWSIIRNRRRLSRRFAVSQRRKTSGDRDV
ncbi:MAG: CDP-alcohol phosphatidyltransferase family protein [Planctomycetes bacterium]|nr:CDP-alcohol phosphatidyltransferase family protein [Planctomycetota bacterium]